MKNNKTKVFLLISILLLTGSLGGIATAATTTSTIIPNQSALLYMTPSSAYSSLTLTIGDSVESTMNLNAAQNEVCTVTGELAFKNLTCEDITIAGNVNATIIPTCSNPKFSITIPNCTKLDGITLLTTSTKTENIGPAAVSILPGEMKDSKNSVVGIAGREVAYDVTDTTTTNATLDLSATQNQTSSQGLKVIIGIVAVLVLGAILYFALKKKK